MDIKLVPEGYTQLEYIEQPLGNSGYIKTGIDASNTIGFTIEFETHDYVTTSSATNAFGVIFGARYTKANAFLLGTYRATAGGELKTGTSAKNPHIVKDTKIKCSLSGTTYQNGEFTETVTRNASNFQEIYLFCNNTAGTAEEFGHYKLYSLKFVDNGVTLRHFIPCINPDNVVGLYDRITKGFFTSANDVVFTAGPVKTITLTAIAEKAVEVNYIKEDLRSAINEHYGTEELVYSDGLVEYADAIDNIDTSNYTLPTEPKAVNFIDYDGTLLYAYTAQEFQAMEGLPRNPWHSGLIAQGWNWTREEILDYLTRAERIDISQNYITDDGATRLYIHKRSLATQYLCYYQSIAGSMEVDWGDGTEHTITNSTGPQISHQYAETGDYIIRIIPRRECIFDLTTSQNSNQSITIFGSVNARRALFKELYKVELGANITHIGHSAFNFFSELETITVPTFVKDFRNNCFTINHRLKHICIPREARLRTYAFNQCSSFKYLCLPPNVTIDSNAHHLFDVLYKLKYALIPDSVAYFPNQMFANCEQLEHIYVSRNTTIIPTDFVRSCFCLKEINIPTSVEVFGSTNVGGYSYCFGSCWSLTKLIIPEGATVWPAYTAPDCMSVVEFDFPSTLLQIGVNSIKSFTPRRIIFRATTPPSLAASAAISGLSSLSKIYVPYSEDHSILEAYKTATNWSALASYMTELNSDGTIPTE